MVREGTAVQAPPRPAAVDAWQPPTVAPTPAPTVDQPTPVGLPWSAPTRVRIPTITVDAPLTPVTVDGEGRIAPPPTTSPTTAGWYRDGVTPGSLGTAVLVGHVDTARGPAVFWDLGALHRGDRIEVARTDGTTAAFTVDAVRVFDRADFPVQQVYGSTGRPELRVITCGGGYSKSTGYRGNVVVFAHLTPR
ncbi:class F sortase [Kitasatospora camelliae]|uniref:Class F sortase n=1 Tax=Kitasatospora camelliae TaxID=3156397 RepID=A0AAU8K970_9ACTN